MNISDLGQLTRHEDGYQIRLERVYPHNIRRVWEALTTPAMMSTWFTDVEMDFVPGGKMVIRFQDEEGTESTGKILRIEEPRLFEFLWENEDGPDELAHWELFDEGPVTCRLVLTYSRVAEGYATSVSAGWHNVLDDLALFLDGVLDAQPFGSGETERGKALKAEYEKIWESEFGAKRPG